MTLEEALELAKTNPDCDLRFVLDKNLSARNIGRGLVIVRCSDGAEFQMPGKVRRRTLILKQAGAAVLREMKEREEAREVV